MCKRYYFGTIVVRLNNERARMAKDIKDLKGNEKIIAWVFIWVIVIVALILIGTGLIKFLQWAF